MPGSTIKTFFGPIYIEWEASRILGITLGKNVETEKRICPFPQLIDYFNGKVVDFSNYQLDLAWYSPFAKRVLDICRQIPYGELISYQQLADRLGNPKACRAVGNALGKNRYPVIIPCHRVIGSQGKLGGFSAGSGWKKFLIDWESVHK